MDLFAYYLPQFYPTPENDKHWGKGFTEWRNVAAAKPLFRGHEQPKIPRDFGFYDLRNVETIRSQAEYAREIGIDGFSFWHYWFGDGQQTLEKPSQLLLENKDIEIDFYFTWVNEAWTTAWTGGREVIFKQKYNLEDYKAHFEYLLPFFLDERYYKINNKPVFAVNNPKDFEVSTFIDQFNSLAIKNGFEGIYWLTPKIHTKESQLPCFDSINGYPPGDINLNFSLWEKIKSRLNLFNSPKTIDYKSYIDRYVKHVDSMMQNYDNYIPVFMPNWDNTPRYNKEGMVFVNNKVKYMEELMDALYRKSLEQGNKFMLIKSWNEWAEGNYIEPDMEKGHKIGNSIRKIVSKYSKNKKGNS